jgi:hypothetical protein
VWRYGAPFAHFLPEYGNYEPSFAVFGKAVGAGGHDVHWDVVYVKRHGYADFQYINVQAHFIHL